MSSSILFAKTTTVRSQSSCNVMGLMTYDETTFMCRVMV